MGVGWSNSLRLDSLLSAAHKSTIRMKICMLCIPCHSRYLSNVTLLIICDLIGVFGPVVGDAGSRGWA